MKFFQQNEEIETIEDAKKAMNELQDLGVKIFVKAEEKGFGDELRLYSIQRYNTDDE